MKKYIEELVGGECFLFDSSYIITTDFKKNGDRLSVSLKDGTLRWFSASTIVEESQLYHLDKDNNIIPLRVTEKPDANN